MIHASNPANAHHSKTIGRYGSVCLIANNVVGPAMVSIATSYAQAGWAPTTGLLVLCSVLAIMATHFLCETIKAVPGNESFDKRIELTDAIKVANVPRSVFLICFWSFVLLFLFTNTAAIVEVNLSLIPQIFCQTTSFGACSCALLGHCVCPASLDLLLPAVRSNDGPAARLLHGNFLRHEPAPESGDGGVRLLVGRARGRLDLRRAQLRPQLGLFPHHHCRPPALLYVSLRRCTSPSPR